MITQDKSASFTQFYTWHNYRCAYEVFKPINSTSQSIPLLLIHPVGVGLSRQFWQRFCREWYQQGNSNQIYNPDLLGCGESDKPHVACTPGDWAEQLRHFVQTVVQKPVIVVVQGALFAVAIELVKKEPNLIAGLVIATPPAWPLIQKEAPEWQKKGVWNLLNSPLGHLFYRYARREKFLRNFSIKQLFESANSVDAEWLNTLRTGAEDIASRYAVFSFLAGFWLKDYSSAVVCIKQPALVVVGENVSSISQEGKELTADEWLADYLTALPQASVKKAPGRNVLPYESTTEFVSAISPFINEISSD
ncbi:alpha/beta hydrolase [Chlorogloeopsis sp. ULAP02]|uniref:alpha/beta fold hydrolase n=1 Tax=Chlorogloeopsis sp. ULAP02 TaxID=3107926 RepID=UPI003136BE51